MLNPKNAFDFVAKSPNQGSDKACDKNQAGQYYTYGPIDFLSTTQSEPGFGDWSRMSKAFFGLSTGARVHARFAVCHTFVIALQMRKADLANFKKAFRPTDG